MPGNCLFVTAAADDMKNYRQAASDLAAGKYDECAGQESDTAIADRRKSGRLLPGEQEWRMCVLEIIRRPSRILPDALNCEKVGKALKKDILSYRAAAYLKIKAL